MKPRQLHFLRHARTTAPPGTLVGATEVDLSPEGRVQADSLAIRLPKGVVCLCSPMRRCLQTLERLQANGVTREVIFDPRLMEMNFGDWEMKTFAEIADAGGDVNGWEQYSDFRFPGGESVAQFGARLKELLAELHARPEEELLILTHGGVIRTMICLALGLDIKKYLLFNVLFASKSTVELYSEGGVLTALNT